MPPATAHPAPLLVLALVVASACQLPGSPQLATRPGPRPRTTTAPPHSQLDQNAPPAMVEALARFAFALPDVVERPSRVSVPGARALVLRDGVQGGPPDAFMTGREFAHIHPAPDGSLHLVLPVGRARLAIAKGWAEARPAGMRGQPGEVMMYGPRDAAELEVAKSWLRESYWYAGGRH